MIERTDVTIFRIYLSSIERERNFKFQSIESKVLESCQYHFNIKSFCFKMKPMKVSLFPIVFGDPNESHMEVSIL